MQLVFKSYLTTIWHKFKVIYLQFVSRPHVPIAKYVEAPE